MSYVICGALTKTGVPCAALTVPGGKRCHYHGGFSTGPITLMGKLRNGATLKRYRINGAKGPRTNKTRLKREAMALRLQAWRDREPIRRKKALKWANRQRIKSGLPLLTDAELDTFVADSET